MSDIKREPTSQEADEQKKRQEAEALTGDSNDRRGAQRSNDRDVNARNGTVGGYEQGSRGGNTLNQKDDDVTSR
jgi:hypothetical protein